MKNNQPSKPKIFSIMGEICKLIPTHFVSKVSRELGVDRQARTYSPWSHIVSLLYAQLSHALSLNDVCDALSFHKAHLQAIRGASAPARNTFSHANRQRDPQLARRLFWETFSHLQHSFPSFGRGTRHPLAFRFKRLIHIVDSTTIALVANCMDWARHRRRKAAAKCHLRLDLHSLLPRFVIIQADPHHDSHKTFELCAEVKAGEIVVFDKAYAVFDHLYALALRGIVWVTRPKDSLTYRVLESRPVSGTILRDDIVALTVPQSLQKHPAPVRRVQALVEVDGQIREMVFMTNNFQWAASSVCDLYRCRWQIEVFFKQIKQTLQLADFLGHNEKAVKWQLWISLLLYILLRFQAWLHGWNSSFSRLFTLLRATMWMPRSIAQLLKIYGTASPSKQRIRAHPQGAFLPGMFRFMTS